MSEPTTKPLPAKPYPCAGCNGMGIVLVYDRAKGKTVYQKCGTCAGKAGAK